MRRTFLFVLLLSAAVHFGKAQTKKTMEKQFTAVEKEVLDAVLAMTNAFHKGDIEGVMASYEPEATVVFEPGSSTTDRDEIKVSFEQAFMIKPQFVYNGHEVFVNGDIGTHFAPWTMTGMAPDGSVIKSSGLSVAVLRKQPDGKWLIVFDNPYGNNLINKH